MSLGLRVHDWSIGTSRYAALLFVNCKRNLKGRNGMQRWLGLGLLLATGLGSGALAQGSAKFDGQYMGNLRSRK